MPSYEQETKTIAIMIGIYCRAHHGDAKQGEDSLCPECHDLLHYALSRIEACSFKEDNKHFCSHCEVHCYKPEMREKIRTVMRFSGPRMLWHNPVMAVRHLIAERRSKRSE